MRLIRVLRCCRGCRRGVTVLLAQVVIRLLFTPFVRWGGWALGESVGFLVKLVEGGSVPREYTYRLFCNKLDSAGRGIWWARSCVDTLRMGLLIGLDK